ncbi:hypothetical protein BT93_I0940 [Corymbia citriodora subsp. variegata]|nr:hypothetical protein BT93_I0940 [Corymbia citriodora subsp. variegata]
MNEGIKEGEEGRVLEVGEEEEDEEEEEEAWSSDSEIKNSLECLEKTAKKRWMEPSLPIHDVRMVMEGFTCVSRRPRFNPCLIGARNSPPISALPLWRSLLDYPLFLAICSRAKTVKDYHKDDGDGEALSARTKLTRTTEGWSGLDMQHYWPGGTSAVDARRSSLELTLVRGG